jgi:site-specific DNA recombinase
MTRTGKHTTPANQTAVLYARVSTLEQSLEGHSLPMQETRLRAYCDMRGLMVVNVIVDAGVSGGIALEEREGGQRIVELVKAGAVAHVVALKLDRLFRDCADCLTVTKEWDKRNVALHLIDLGGQTLDTSSAMGRFFLTIMAGAAELEKNLIGERTSQALQHKRAQGERVGTVAYGYQLDTDGIRLVANPQEQEVLSLARMYSGHGLSLRKIATRLASEGYVSRRGKPFVPPAIANMLASVVGDTTPWRAGDATQGMDQRETRGHCEGSTPQPRDHREDCEACGAVTGPVELCAG